MALKTPGRERDRGRNRSGDGEHLSAISRDGLLAWEQPGLRIFVGWSGFVFAMLMLAGAWVLRTRPADGDLPGLALLILFMAASGSTFQAGVFWFFCRLQDALPHTLILTAIGYRSRGDLATADSDWTRFSALRRLEIVAVPSLLLGVGAAVVGAIDVWWSDVAEPQGAIFESPLKVAAWTWTLQVVWMLLPIPGSRGRYVLEAFSGLLAPRSTNLAVCQRANLIQGLIGIAMVGLGWWAWQWESNWYDLPAWPLVVALGILIWSGRRRLDEVASNRIPDPGEMRIEATRTAKRGTPSFAKAMLGRWRVRRALREERAEATDERDLDAILEKLHQRGRQSLTAPERGLLARVSRRLRSKK